MRTPVIAGNWKMNTTVDEAVELVSAMRPGLEAIETVERLVCPPFVSLAAVSAELRGSPVAVGAQNLYHEDKGAYTGEISPLMIKPLAQYVIIGHSERRQYFGETDESVNLKVQAALRHGLIPIVCVGERLEERDAGQAEAVVRRQTRGAFAGLDSLGPTIIAYEPVWAIGTGRAATADQASAICAVIRETVGEQFGAQAGEGLRIQYGGSVTPANIAEFVGQDQIDGALVGGASLKADDFVEIVRLTANSKSKNQ